MEKECRRLGGIHLVSLIDQYGRILNYVRISITDRCNYRCRYCMPEKGITWFPHEKMLRYEDIIFLVSVLKEMGVTKIRFTGGEPFVRKGFLSFLRDFQNSFPEIEIALTTNGSLLSSFAEEISDIRLSGLNISLDTLDPAKFKHITRVGNLEDVLEGIKSVASLKKIPLKINSVLIRNFNDDEIVPLLQFAEENGAMLRLIEFMPLDDIWDKDSFISSDEILQSLPLGKWQDISDNSPTSCVSGPAKYYRNLKWGYILGIIAAVSHHFCDSCNRLRVTALGEMKPCLFSDESVELGTAIRIKDKDCLKELILKAVSIKPSGWKMIDRSDSRMSRIGG